MLASGLLCGGDQPLRFSRGGGMLTAMLRRACLALAVTVVAIVPAGSADMRPAFRDPANPAVGTIEIQLRGSIERGDVDKLNALIVKLEGEGRTVRNLSLGSPGGSVSEGLLLAREVRRRSLVTGVPRDSECASACFLLFAAGQGKIVQEGARVGVHGASVDGRETDAAARATIIMAREVARLGVPPAIIGRMAITPPSEMVWLSREELATMAGQYGHVLQD